MSKWKNDIEFHESLRQCANGAYVDQPHPKGYAVIAETTNPETGFAAVAYQRGDRIVLSFRGTENIIGKDGKNDAQMAFKKIPEQYEKAKEFTDVIQKYANLKNCDLTLTGHSLGGSLAQIVGSTQGIKTVAFNAYGTKDILENNNMNYDSNYVVNYVNKHDGIATMNSQNYIGDTYEMKSMESTPFWADHFLDQQSPITEQIPITPEELKRKEGVEAVNNWVNNTVEDVVGGFSQVAKNVRDFGASTVDNVKTGVQNVGSAIVDNVGNVVKPAVEKFEKAISNQGDGGVLQEGAASVIPQEQNSTAHLLQQKNNEKSPVSGDFAPSNQKGGLFGDLIEEQKLKPLSSTNNIGNMWDINTSFGTPTGGAAGVGGFGGSSVLGEIEPINANVISNNVSSVADNFAARKAQKYDYNNKHFGGIRERNGKKEVFVKDYKRSNGDKIPSHWQAISGDFDPNKRLSELEEPELGHAVGFWMDEDKFWW